MGEKGGKTNGLDLIANEENVVLLAKRLTLFKVILIRYDDARFALDRLNDERRRFLSVRIERTLERAHVVEGDRLLFARLGVGEDGSDTLEEGSEFTSGFRVGAHTDDRNPIACHIAIRPND